MDFKIKIETKELDKLIKNIQTSKNNNLKAKVGVINGGNEVVDGITVASYGMHNEFGSITKNIPERSFIRKPLNKHLAEEVLKLQNHFSKLLIQEQNFKLATEKLGILGTNIIKKAFRNKNDGEWKANALATVSKKGVDNALIDTSRLIKTIDYEVINNG